MMELCFLDTFTVPQQEEIGDCPPCWIQVIYAVGSWTLGVQDIGVAEELV